MILIYNSNKTIHQSFDGFGSVSVDETTGNFFINGNDTTTKSTGLSWKYIADQVLERDVVTNTIILTRPVTVTTMREDIVTDPFGNDHTIEIPESHTEYEEYTEEVQADNGYLHDADYYAEVSPPVSDADRLAALEQYVMDKELGLI